MYRDLLAPFGLCALLLPSVAGRLPSEGYVGRSIHRPAFGPWPIPANNTFHITIDSVGNALLNIAVKATAYTTVTFTKSTTVTATESLTVTVTESTTVQSTRGATSIATDSRASMTTIHTTTQGTVQTQSAPVISTSMTKEANASNPSLCVDDKCYPKLPSTVTSVPFGPGSTDPAGQLPTHKPPTMLFNFTEKCDSVSELAEDCRITLNCDTSMGLYPTCEDSECKCLAKPCLRASTCFPFNQCRTDFEEHFCTREMESDTSTNPLGLCGCRPRITDCLLKGTNPHYYCGADFNCTEPYFSLYPEFPQCNTGDPKYPKGRCQCGQVNCPKSGTDRDFEVCKDLINCETSGLGRRSYCNVKYGNESTGRQDGYCTCV
ncbi:hypothetical protein PT974_08223 [Cladobotryum mycophilum]|uniref:Uncharacterized protein n=1 Tax=Cladobotryum mycophilum TaxID=491253 RepID=A0ABR0SDX3_9HYPO